MAYATRADLTARFGEAEVSDREAMLGTDAATIALSDATAEMEVYLDNRYLVPLNPVPLAAVGRCCDIARYRLLGDTAGTDVRARYTDAIAWLIQVQTGGVNLDGQTAKVGGNPEARVEILPGRRVFCRGIL